MNKSVKGSIAIKDRYTPYLSQALREDNNLGCVNVCEYCDTPKKDIFKRCTCCGATTYKTISVENSNTIDLIKGSQAERTCFILPETNELCYRVSETLHLAKEELEYISPGIVLDL